MQYFLEKLCQLVLSVLQAIYGKKIPKIDGNLSSTAGRCFLGASRNFLTGNFDMRSLVTGYFDRKNFPTGNFCKIQLDL